VIVHLSWNAMVGIGTGLVVLGLWGLLIRLRRRDYATSRWFLRVASISGSAAVAALEAGWIVTEVGRQPWVVYNVLRTEDAVTDHGGIWLTFAIIVTLYALVATGLIGTLRVLARRWRSEDEGADSDVPYGPRGPLRLGDEGVTSAAGDKVGV
jgi:cytochrome d ubiquinol oxidase subunit I